MHFQRVLAPCRFINVQRNKSVRFSFEFVAISFLFSVWVQAKDQINCSVYSLQANINKWNRLTSGGCWNVLSDLQTNGFPVKFTLNYLLIRFCNSIVRRVIFGDMKKNARKLENMSIRKSKITSILDQTRRTRACTHTQLRMFPLSFCLHIICAR